MALSVNGTPQRWRRLWLAIGWLGVAGVVWLSLTGKPPVTLDFAWGDKVGHVAAYGVLMGWFARLLSRRGGMLYSLLLIAMGVLLEFLQRLTGRTFEWADMAADVMGVVVGALVLATPLALLRQWCEQCLGGARDKVE